MIKGQVIGGEFANVRIRQKSGHGIELGEILVCEKGNHKILLQAIDLSYGSQISQSNLELISGLKLEEENDLEIMDSSLRNYNIAIMKNLITIDGNDARVCKILPDFFSEVRELKKEDLRFLTKPENPLYLGKLRSGSKTVDVEIFLDGKKALCEHILIPATTGRGKSNLTSCMIWECVDKDYCGLLVLDPHDEYFGRSGIGLKDHPMNEKIIYYTPNRFPGALSLKINLKSVKPSHFSGVVSWSDPQKEALAAYYRKFSKEWVESLLLYNLENFSEGTLNVIKRRLMNILNIEISSDQILCNGIFAKDSGHTTVEDICNHLEESKTVIVDTSSFSGQVEILIGSIITSELFSRYKRHRKDGVQKPVVSIILEEAPRVLGKEVLEKGSNIFSQIAREGRKFNVGLVAITQLPSLIPKQILANLNTKIILGIEMSSERQAIIDSANQDLSADSRTIASLDKGEAIISSNFVKFATPVKIPLFSELVKETQNRMNREKYIKKEYVGL